MPLSYSLRHDLSAAPNFLRIDNPMKKILTRFLADQSGATAIEYGLIASLIAVVAITTLKGVGSKLNNKFGSVSNGLN
jgi:pilus assembly protein Flp/PilA